MNINTDFEKFISSFDFPSFIAKYKDAEPNSLVFKLKKEFGSYYPFLAEQLKLYKKSLRKLPIFAENHCLYTLKSFEQSSSEALAVFKAKLFNGKILLDLSGGLGVDDWAFSKSFSKVITIDNDSELNIITGYNFNRLGVNNIERMDADSYEFIIKNNKYDLIYLDSDRRSKSNLKKSILLEESEPSIVKMKERLFELSDTILLKLSPLIDLTYLIKRLENVSAIYVISMHNEIKEILALLTKDYKGEKPLIKAIDISSHEKESEYSAVWKKEVLNTFYNIDSNPEYFYEPAACLIKSSLAKNYAEYKKLNIISNNCLYFTGNELLNGFFGRSFKIIHLSVFSKSAVWKYLDENKIKKANVGKRNFPVEVWEIKKLFNLNDGGDEYLFFGQNDKNKKLFFHCRKVINIC